MGTGCDGLLKLQCCSVLMLGRAGAGPLLGASAAASFAPAPPCSTAASVPRAGAAGGKTISPAHPEACAVATQVLKLLLASPGCWLCGRREPPCVALPRARAHGDLRGVTGYPKYTRHKEAEPGECCRAQQCVWIPPRQRRAGTEDGTLAPQKRGRSWTCRSSPVQCSPGPLRHSSSVSPRLLGDSCCSPLAGVTSDKPGCRRTSSSPAAGRESCS